MFLMKIVLYMFFCCPCTQAYIYVNSWRSSHRSTTRIPRTERRSPGLAASTLTTEPSHIFSLQKYIISVASLDYPEVQVFQ